MFITGTPRSGTSMLTKIIDAHPDVAILMENIFENRRRHWTRAKFWDDENKFKAEINKIYSNLEEPIIGNKVITPDVWSIDDIIKFCNVFRSSKVIWIVRDPLKVFESRYKREDFAKEYNEIAKKNLHFDFSHRTFVYASSWRQNIENYYRLVDLKKDDVILVYYDDLILNFENYIKDVFSQINIEFHENVLKWNTLAHYNHNGKLVKNLKYPDKPVVNTDNKSIFQVPRIEEALSKIAHYHDLWKKREL